ncbi:hypothetical protein DFJ58DRAFT_799604 [Suillus subalutaceus]|uniref:uncharacterized protein n=1 Tax=Suillus subalutaceus TaxID=48586 RepID=UPI001B870A10|nr:uncharacterized protein DFJ58DRAFT_799604 [Suillus subalutaceus]KAG1846045.1 hypothetical protein DFJ58DRAFT_799604 [Suillus subalutaceus]
MHFSLLVVIASLTAFMFVSATPAVLSRECTANGGDCKEGSQCCSGVCYITSGIDTIDDNGNRDSPFALCNSKFRKATPMGFASIRVRYLQIPKSCYIGVSHGSAFVLELLFMTRFLVTCWVDHYDRC